jgi:hypothetical protein
MAADAKIIAMPANAVSAGTESHFRHRWVRNALIFGLLELPDRGECWEFRHGWHRHQTSTRQYVYRKAGPVFYRSV